KQQLLPESEWDAFVASMRQPLPTTFRINANGPFAMHIRDEMERHVAESFSQPLEVEGERVEAPRVLPWYPDRLGWHLNISRQQLRTLPELNRLFDFIKRENEIGAITRQEAVSMIPPLLLDVQPHHNVLDMCAAPGSKTFQLLEMLHGGCGPAQLPSGMVVANELDIRRCHLLVHQTQRLSSPCILVTNHAAQLFPSLSISSQPSAAAAAPAPAPAAAEVEKKGEEKGEKAEAVGAESKEQEGTKEGGAEGEAKGEGKGEGEGEGELFDRILCDVPCSGDGTMRKAPDIWKKWNTGNGNGLHALQIKIAMRGGRWGSHLGSALGGGAVAGGGAVGLLHVFPQPPRERGRRCSGWLSAAAALPLYAAAALPLYAAAALPLYAAAALPLYAAAALPLYAAAALPLYAAAALPLSAAAALPLYAAAALPLYAAAALPLYAAAALPLYAAAALPLYAAAALPLSAAAALPLYAAAAPALCCCCPHSLLLLPSLSMLLLPTLSAAAHALCCCPRSLLLPPLSAAAPALCCCCPLSLLLPPLSAAAPSLCCCPRSLLLPTLSAAAPALCCCPRSLLLLPTLSAAAPSLCCCPLSLLLPPLSAAAPSLCCCPLSLLLPPLSAAAPSLCCPQLVPSLSRFPPLPHCPLPWGSRMNPTGVQWVHASGGLLAHASQPQAFARPQVVEGGVGKGGSGKVGRGKVGRGKVGKVKVGKGGRWGREGGEWEASRFRRVSPTPPPNLPLSHKLFVLPRLTPFAAPLLPSSSPSLSLLLSPLAPTLPSSSLPLTPSLPLSFPLSATLSFHLSLPPLSFPAEVVEEEEEEAEAEVCEQPVELCVRVLPHQQDTGGFFIAVLDKVAPYSGAEGGEAMEVEEEGGNADVAGIDAENAGANDDDQDLLSPNSADAPNSIDGVSEPGDPAEEAEADAEADPADEPDAAAAVAGPGDSKEQEKQQRAQRRQQQGRWRGVDPVLFLSDEPTIASVEAFYGILPAFPLRSQLIVRSEAPSHSKRIYLVSKPIAQAIRANQASGQRLKMVSTGVKLFERQSTKDGEVPCCFRLSAEGLPFILPFIMRQLVHLLPPLVSPIHPQPSQPDPTALFPSPLPSPSPFPHPLSPPASYPAPPSPPLTGAAEHQGRRELFDGVAKAMEAGGGGHGLCGSRAGPQRVDEFCVHSEGRLKRQHLGLYGAGAADSPQGEQQQRGQLTGREAAVIVWRGRRNVGLMLSKVESNQMLQWLDLPAYADNDTAAAASGAADDAAAAAAAGDAAPGAAADDDAGAAAGAAAGGSAEGEQGAAAPAACADEPKG
ncbi:unnamed protein product, partial [Closterium sp. Naga37s-1]